MILLARSLARFRSQPNPSAKLLVGIIVFSTIGGKTFDLSQDVLLVNLLILSRHMIDLILKPIT